MSAQSNLPAILIALLSFFVFTLQDTAVKFLGEEWHVVQTAALNALGCLVAPTIWAMSAGGLRLLRPRNVRLHLTRAILAPFACILVFYAYAVLPLTDAYAIAFSQPLIITALSVPILGEKVGWRRWSAVAVGFLGVLIMLRPGSGLLGPAAICMLAASGLWGFIHAIIRLAPDDHPSSFAVWVNVGIFAGMLPLLPFVWTTPTGPQLLISLVGGLMGGAGFTLMSLAYSKAEAGIVAPFQYVQMLYAAVIGLVVFGDALPDQWTWLGTAIVIASGIYIIHRETVRRRQALAHERLAAAASLP
ncbi:MAG TPA: DMT family transporter [Geminicoccus sp.]|jgi:drug/metabolite transporter (DMT)-like permease|uniref:DMT family transporter n=1 Tax=Geminicoccus sp. TaxID=2024832 RepID=UPI002E32C3D3|nr:DMT family transporter [Geminicoccus sp.]HEX2529127.1 DMT family transporter [Geminicoccus sp.]